MLPVDSRKITLGVVGTLAGVSLIVFAVLHLLLSDPQNDPLPDAARRDHAAVRREIDAAAERKLSTYGWVDKANGVVRIPVERARELWLKEKGASR